MTPDNWLPKHFWLEACLQLYGNVPIFILGLEWHANSFWAAASQFEQTFALLFNFPKHCQLSSFSLIAIVIPLMAYKRGGFSNTACRHFLSIRREVVEKISFHKLWSSWHIWHIGYMLNLYTWTGQWNDWRRGNEYCQMKIINMYERFFFHFKDPTRPLRLTLLSCDITLS